MRRSVRLAVFACAAALALVAVALAAASYAPTIGIFQATYRAGDAGPVTVVVAQDGISAEPEFPTTVTRWQLLNEPGFTNADNKPLAEKLVTLSRGDLITFK